MLAGLQFGRAWPGAQLGRVGIAAWQSGDRGWAEQCGRRSARMTGGRAGHTEAHAESKRGEAKRREAKRREEGPRCHVYIRDAAATSVATAAVATAAAASSVPTPSTDAPTDAPAAPCCRCALCGAKGQDGGGEGSRVGRRRG